MKFFDFFKTKSSINENEFEQKEQNIRKYQEVIQTDMDVISEILDHEITMFFLKFGAWNSDTFKKSRKLIDFKLQSYLNDYNWLSLKMKEYLIKEKDIYIPQRMIRKYMMSSEKFVQLREDYLNNTLVPQIINKINSLGIMNK